jgi:hypothetical protein
MPGIKVLAYWPNWGGMMGVVHFNKKSWVDGNDKYGRKVMMPSHYQFTPEPPSTT